MKAIFGLFKGELQCCGSPLYLKSKYGSGYNLVITRNNRRLQQPANSAYADESSRADDEVVERINSLVSSQVPNSAMQSNVNSELSFVLPTVESSRFPALFEKLDKLKDDLGILNVGVSITTLEEVFLK
jgi:ATP-binding cassette subfamily A (ABC1) protein 3